MTLANPRWPQLAPIEVEAQADTAAVHLRIPQHIALQLQLEEIDQREVALADGSRRVVSYVGPLAISIANRRGVGGAIVFGDQVLLGAIPMEDMDLVVLPRTQEVVPNPANPNIAGSIAVGVRNA